MIEFLAIFNKFLFRCMCSHQDITRWFRCVSVVGRGGRRGEGKGGACVGNCK